MASKAGTVPSAKGPVGTDDNEPKGLTDDQRRDLLLVHLKKAREDNGAMEKAMEAVRAVRKMRNRNRNECKTDGFSLKNLDEILADESKAQSELKQAAELRTFMRSTACLPVTGDDQMDLFDAAKTIKGDASLDQDDAHWAGVAFAVALRGGDYAPAANGVPPERIQAWEGGIHAGIARIGSAMKSYQAIEERRVPANAG